MSVRLELADRVALITIDDPERRNAMSVRVSDALVEVLDEVEGSLEVRAVVITGVPPAFSAGADLGDLEMADRGRLRRIYEGFLAVARCPWPTIAAVNGPAVGAGMNLALACDVRIAGRSAVFDSRFLDLALHPGGGHTWMLERLLGVQGAAAVALLGEALDGEEAAGRGLAWRCVEDEVLLEEAVQLASRVARAPGELVRRIKANVVRARATASHEEAVEQELEDQLWSLGQDEFKGRLAALKARISRRSRKG